MTIPPSSIAPQIGRAFTGPAWHGEAIAELLAGVTAKEAEARPFDDLHTIAELVGHIGAWTAIAERRLAGETGSPGESDVWPEVNTTTEKAWAAAVADCLEKHRSLKDKFLKSAFLADFRKLAAETTRGCIVLERPDLLKKLVEAHGAKDATARQTALAELGAMTPRTSQYNPRAEVPEKNVFYRLAKRLFFNDFGAYTGHDARHAQVSAPAVLGR